MKSIVFLGANKSGSSREAIQAAERLGYFTILLTDRPRFLEQRDEFPDVHHMERIDLHDNEKIRSTLRQLQKRGLIIHAITSFIEPFVYKAAKFSKEFCATDISTKAISIMESKTKTRRALAKLSSSPKFFIYKQKQPLLDFIARHQAKLPLIVKAPHSTGSKDVILAENTNAFQQAITSLIKKYPDSPVLVEEYLEGPQYLVETLVHRGTLHIAGIAKQKIVKEDRFIVTGYHMHPSPTSSLYTELYQTINVITKKLKMRNGAAHFEFRKTKNGWKLIEINPRISGGVMNRLIEVSTGINLMEETLKLFLGETPSLTPEKSKHAYAHYLTVNRNGSIEKVTGKSRASRYPGVEHVYVKPRKGQRVQRPLSMGHRYGYVLASANRKKKAITTAKTAAKEITFHITKDEHKEN